MMVRKVTHRAIVATEPATYRAFTFVVQGQGPFPQAMLSLDQCLPLNNDEFIVAFAQHSGQRKVTLITFRKEGEDFRLLSSKWEDFGWDIITDTIRLVTA